MGATGGRIGKSPPLFYHRAAVFGPCRRQLLPVPEVISMSALISPSVLPILLLIGSNVFMTFAWYGHLKFTSTPLVTVIFISWGIALIEYCMAVPANRIGHEVYSAAQLKTIQEVITLVIFSLFSVFYLKEAFTWHHLLGFALIAGGAALIFKA
ncbi:hypothetical protein L614_000400002290 [Ochrobactrum sp. J50]|jgi:uncharacterized protein (DUF486 family)|nr:hypothetical protein L614_000400002290 [Ochrobactrum sp. J50]